MTPYRCIFKAVNDRKTPPTHFNRDFPPEPGRNSRRADSQSPVILTVNATLSHRTASYKKRVSPTIKGK